MNKKILSWLLVATIIITNFMGDLQLTYAASEDNANIFNYAMVSLSKSEDLVINANGGNLSGNIASNKSIRVGNLNRNCNILENQSLEYPDLINASYEKYFELLINENTTKSIKDNQNLNISENIRAISDIEINSQTINGNDLAIISETGSINIESNNISISGFIYAPKGKIKITGDNLNLNGICIIADTIEIVANNVNINGNQKIIEWINQYISIDLSEYYLYGFGVYSENVIKIYWNTNITGSIDIYESFDNVSYSKVITLDDTDTYEYAVTNQFDVKYIKLSAKGLSSIPFLIKRVEDGYETSLLDSDSDGLADLFEEIYETDKYSVDTDNDKLSDYDEIVFTHTNPIIYDSVNQGKADGDIDLDGDGLDNKSEIVVATNPLEYDTDGDKLGDYDELYKYNTNPVNADTDLDGLYDGSELRFLTDPLNPDSNNNGIKDGDETYEQDLMDECYEDSIMVENIAIPSITVVQNGDASVNTICSEYAGHLKGDGHEFVGKCIEVTGSAALSGKISFKLDNTYVLPEYKFGDYNTNGLLICVNKDETTIPLETTYDVTTRTLSADFVDDGIYFVMDAVYWLDSLGIDASDVVEDLENEYINATENINTFSMRNSEQTKGVPYADENKEVSIAGKQVSSQVDIVFIVDTTGSMSSYITNVKNNINSFVDTLTSANIKPYFALVEYRDITCDGKNSTNAKINSLNNTCWFNTAETFKSQIASLNISGGGDTPETTIDGLEFARRLNMRESSDKFFIVVTDAGFKVDNNYNINSMDEMISLLVEGKINTSVITNSNYKNEYSNLYTTTGGIYANVGGNFKEELISIANQIIENTNDGSWIVLNGLTPQIVKLKEKPMYGSRVDSDSDSLTDVDELGTLVPVKKYNAARYMFTLMPTLMPVGSEKWDMYVYNYKSNPVKVDTDGDLDIDSIDPEPRAYQLNDLLCYNISKLNDLAIVYKNQNKYSSREYNTKVESWLTFMFIRQFSRSYVGGNWNGTGKAIDTGFVNYVKAEDAALYAYFESKTDYYATATGEMGDLYHLAATATGYIYNSDFGDGFQFGLMREYHLNNLSGWAGDLQTAMNDAMVITNKSNDYNVFKEAMSNLIGYDEEVNDVYSGYSHTFDMDDVYADIDAYNMYKLLKNGKTIEDALDNYYKSGYRKRYTEFTNNWSEATVKNTTYIYTKNKYMGVIRWPLFDYDFQTNQSKAARDAFAEFVLERRKNE